MSNSVKLAIVIGLLVAIRYGYGVRYRAQAVETANARVTAVLEHYTAGEYGRAKTTFADELYFDSDRTVKIPTDKYGRETRDLDIKATTNVIEEGSHFYYFIEFLGMADSETPWSVEPGVSVYIKDDDAVEVQVVIDGERRIVTVKQNAGLTVR